MIIWGKLEICPYMPSKVGSYYSIGLPIPISNSGIPILILNIDSGIETVWIPVFEGKIWPFLGGIFVKNTAFFEAIVVRNPTWKQTH